MSGDCLRVVPIDRYRLYYFQVTETCDSHNWNFIIGILLIMNYVNYICHFMYNITQTGRLKLNSAVSIDLYSFSKVMYNYDFIITTTTPQR